MFNLFKSKSEKEKLQEKYKKMMEKAYKLSHTDRKASDQLTADAQKVLDEIDKLK